MALLARVPPSSDFLSWRQIFVKHMYAPLLDMAHEPRHILDLGAYVGYASKYFAENFPDADITALEPDVRSYVIAKINLASTKRVRVLHGGVWPYSCRLSLQHGGDGLEWGEQTVEKVGGDILAYTIDDLLPKPLSIDILKMDIEGTEHRLFESPDFLDRTKVLAIEIHEDPDPILTKLKEKGFDYFKHGETYFAEKS